VPDRGETVTVAKPDETSFAYVHPVMMRRCGTLDCHGDGYRNMRIVGYLGRRLDTNATPVQDVPHGGLPTTTAELDTTYRSVTGLEPEILTGVVRGTRPVEDLTLIRKGRYSEFHRGGSPLKDNPLADACLTSWLKGALDGQSCCRELVPTDFVNHPDCCAQLPADELATQRANGVCP
jgi:hypothetical protein